jgi:2-amino-4-hydroxy-6-hydroxymethyldihydropteridine diphosphokinase
MPLVVQLPGGWRWLWLPAIPTILLWPRLRRILPETERFRRAESLGEIGAGMGELFRSRYRRRAAGILLAAFFGNAANVAALTWAMYHLLENVRLPQATASAVVLVGGAVAIAGFPMGGRLCDAWGRRATGTLGAIFSSLFGLAFFWLPPDTPGALPLLAACFGLGNFFRTAKMVAWRVSATELVPTRLRGAMLGWASIVAASSTVLAQLAIAGLVPILGGLVEGASVVALLGIPGALAYWWLVPETAGVELESAALEREPVRAYIGLGSNLGDRAAHLDRALAALAATPGVALQKTSALYETEPLGPPGQGAYLNAVAAIQTSLEPRALLQRLLAIESEAGRARGPERNAPRTLDLDLLLYGESRIEEPGLEVPHPRLHERPFVLEPLRDVAPDLVHPVLGVRVDALAARVRDPAAVRLYAN